MAGADMIIIGNEKSSEKFDDIIVDDGTGR